MMLQLHTFIPAILIPHQHFTFWSERPILRECPNPNRRATRPYEDEITTNEETKIKER